jgi:tetratricopeptide (TPR) repeat protein
LSRGLSAVLVIGISGHARGEVPPQARSNTHKMDEFYSIRKLIENGTPERALEELRVNRRGYQKGSEYYFLEGRAYQDRRDNTKSLMSYTISIHIDPANDRAYINRALVRGALGDLAGSLEDLDSAVKIRPTSAPALMNRGVTKAALNRPHDALRDFTAAIKLDAGYADAYRNRGITYRYVGQLSRACSDWKKAIELKQADVGLWHQQLCGRAGKATNAAPGRTGVRGIQ